MPASALDFLELSIEGGGVTREGATFDVLGPWELAQFGEHAFERGWWIFELEGDIDPMGCEVRLGSAQHPLIVVAGDLAGTFRLHVEEGSIFRVALLVSPWPGKARFTKLRLRRLSGGEQVAMYAAAGKRLLGSDKPLTRIAGAAKRVLAGRTVGVRVSDAAAGEAAGVALAEPGAEVVERHGDVVAVLRQGDRLHPRALEIVRAEFARRAEVKAIYADVSEGGVVTPKSGWDPLLARHCDLAGSPLFVRAESHGGDLGAPARIALPLAARDVALRQRIDGVPAPKLSREPSVSVIIPTKTRIDLLDRCMTGLLHTQYSALEIIVVDNGADRRLLDPVLAETGGFRPLLRVEDFGDFNFPRLIASGVATATGDVVLVFNDDIEAMQPDWLARIVESVMQPDVGAVGARLLYPDGSIQHAGVMMGLGGVCGHLWKGTPPDEAARNPHIVCPGRRMAVTGACLAVRREVWDEVGGMDAAAFPVAFNDIDLCLKLGQRGLQVIYRGDAVLTHHESQSRGADDLDAARRQRLAAETARFLARWQLLLRDDPYGSPAFDPERERGVAHRSLGPRTA